MQSNTLPCFLNATYPESDQKGKQERKERDTVKREMKRKQDEATYPKETEMKVDREDRIG